MPDVREHPILFAGRLVRAIREGRKTETRRVIRPQPAAETTHFGVTSDGEWWACSGDPRDLDTVHVADDRTWRCPFGVPGDRLWVRETWGIGSRPDPHTGDVDGIEYRADVEELEDVERDLLPLYRVDFPDGFDPSEHAGSGWKPSIHMPRWACRQLLEVVAVGVERLQQISVGSAIAEGVTCWICGGPVDGTSEADCGCFHSTKEARPSFQVGWDSLNAKRGFGWDANPWVWVVTFKPIEEDNDAP